MPRVPRYTPQEHLRPLPTPRMDPNAFGAGVGRAVEQGGKTIMSVGDMLAQNALKLYEKVDKTKAKEAYTKLLEQTRDTLYSENGFFARKGKNAVNIYKEGDEYLREAYDSIAGELETERQRQYFRDLATPKMETWRDQLARHEATEIRAWEVEQDKALIANAQNDAVVNYTDPIAYQQAVDEGLAQIEELSAKLGLPEESVKIEKEGFLSDINVSVINQMLANDKAKEAKAWYQEHKDEIKGSVRDEIEKSINNLELTTWAQEQADGIMKRFSSEAEAVEWVRKNYKGKKEEKLVTYVKARFTEKSEAEKEWKKGLFETHAKKIEGMSSSERLAYIDKLNIPATVKDSLYTYAKKLDRSLTINTKDPQYNVKYFEARKAVEDGKYKSYTEFMMDYGGMLTDSHMRDIWKLNPYGKDSKMFSRIKSNVHGLLSDIFGDSTNFVEPTFYEILNDEIEKMDNPTETQIMEKAKQLLKVYQVNKTWGPDPDAYGFQILALKDAIKAEYPDAEYDYKNGYWYVVRDGQKMRLRIEDAPDTSDIPKNAKKWVKD